MSWPEPPPLETYVLRLFVAGTTTRSQRAIACMRRLCEEHLPGRFDLEVIDVYTNPEATRTHQIVATPTLLKLAPAPSRRMIGDLTDQTRVMAGLNITPLGGLSEAPA
jgi:circadian clock protein KaiB